MWSTDREEPAFRIQWRWKEEVIYWEGDRGFLLDAGWGVQPPTLYVPAPAVWDAVAPPWLRGRRDEVVARLAQHSGHVLAEDASDQAMPEYCWLGLESEG